MSERVEDLINYTLTLRSGESPRQSNQMQTIMAKKKATSTVIEKSASVLLAVIMFTVIGVRHNVGKKNWTIVQGEDDNHQPVRAHVSKKDKDRDLPSKGDRAIARETEFVNDEGETVPFTWLD